MESRFRKPIEINDLAVFLVPWFPVLEVIWLPGDAMVEKAEAAWYGHIHKPYRHYGVEL